MRKGQLLWATLCGVGAVIIWGPAAPRAQGAPVIFTSSNATLSATVTFEQINTTDLQVTLANTSTTDVLQPADVLTAVFFTLAGHPTLTRVSAVIAGGSIVLFGTTDPGDVVGGEWAYVNGLSNAPHGADEGISSSGLNWFGPGDRFPGSNLQGPASPGGLQYGITSAGDNPTTGNSAVTGANALTKNTVVFTLSGLPADYVLSASSISAVSFQYGTATGSEPNVPGQIGIIPEPNTWLLVVGALLPIAFFRRR